MCGGGEKDAVKIVCVATKWLLTREIYESRTAFLGGVLYLSDVDCIHRWGKKSVWKETFVEVTMNATLIYQQLASADKCEATNLIIYDNGCLHNQKRRRLQAAKLTAQGIRNHHLIK